MDDHSSKRSKVGPDGLTRSQRYYRNHPEVKAKNCERERLRRQRLKIQKSTVILLPVIEPLNVDAATTAQVSSSTADDAMSSSGHVAMPVPPTEACAPFLASPFIHSSTASPTLALSKPITTSSKKIRFPADFFSTRMLHREACYGEALNVLQENSKIPRHQKRETLLNKVERLTNDALTWCSGWGGVAYWQISLHERHTSACEEDRRDEWEKELLEHAANGRHLLFQLTSVIELLAEGPYESHKVKELLRITMEFMQMVTMGLTVLNMRCSILPNNLWGVGHLYHGSSGEEGGSYSSGDDSIDIDEGSGDLDMFHLGY